MQHDWSVANFARTFHRMLESFGLLGDAAGSPSRYRIVPPERRAVAVVSRRRPASQDIFWYPTRLANALSRTGKYEVQQLLFDNPSDLRANLAKMAPSAIVVDSLELPAKSIEGALDSIAATKVYLAEEGQERSGPRSNQIERVPIIPYFTALEVAPSRPTIWLVGFSAATSNLEAVLAKIAGETPDADVFLEVPERDKGRLEQRVARLRGRFHAIKARSMGHAGEEIARDWSASHLIVFYNDADRTEELQNMCSLALATDRPVVFTRTAPFASFGDGVSYVEDFGVHDLITMGAACQVKVCHQFGEGALFAKLHRLLSEDEGLRPSRGSVAA
jgi:hypothetical protein